MALTLGTDFPKQAPAAPSRSLRYFDIAVTATAAEFKGVYRGKQYHQSDFDAVLDRAATANVEKILLTGMSLSDVEFNLQIARSRPQMCRITVGVHPYHVGEPGSLDHENGDESAYWTKLMSRVHDLSRESPRLIAAFGELGLDYDRLNKAPKEVQIPAFKKQLDLFVESKIDLPLFLHCRSAFEDFRDIIQPYISRLPRSGVVHSFVGTASQMRQLVELGLDVSVNGFSFASKESLQMIRDIPLDKLQIETDAPWGEIGAGGELAKRYLINAQELPGKSKKRDKFELGSRVKERNESCSMEKVAMVVAGLKGVTVEEVADAAWRNSSKMFDFV